MRLSRPFRKYAERLDQASMGNMGTMGSMRRVSGDVICPICGFTLEEHPDDREHLTVDGIPYLKRLCYGFLGKL